MSKTHKIQTNLFMGVAFGRAVRCSFCPKRQKAAAAIPNANPQQITFDKKPEKPTLIDNKF